MSNNEENDVKTIVGPFSCGANIQSGGRINIILGGSAPSPALSLGLFLNMFHETEWLHGHIPLPKKWKKMTSVYIELTSLRLVNSEKLGFFFRGDLQAGYLVVITKRDAEGDWIIPGLEGTRILVLL